MLYSTYTHESRYCVLVTHKERYIHYVTYLSVNNVLNLCILLYNHSSTICPLSIRYFGYSTINVQYLVNLFLGTHSHTLLVPKRYSPHSMAQSIWEVFDTCWGFSTKGVSRRGKNERMDSCMHVYILVFLNSENRNSILIPETRRIRDLSILLFGKFVLSNSVYKNSRQNLCLLYCYIFAISCI